MGKKRFYNRGYYFIIDAFIGSTIIFLTLMIILNNGTRPTNVQYNYDVVEQYDSFLMNTHLKDINNPLVIQMINNGANPDYTVMEQIDKFASENDYPSARLLIANLTIPLIPVKYSVSYDLIVSGTTTNVYNRTLVNISDASIVIASRKITFITLDSSTIYGPAIADIKVWL